MATQGPRTGVIGKAADVEPRAAGVPMHRAVLVTPITDNGRLCPVATQADESREDGDRGFVPLRASSMADFLEKAELAHKFESELNGKEFVVDLHIDTLTKLDPSELEKDFEDGARNDFARLRRRSDALARVRQRLEKAPLAAEFLTDDHKRRAAVQALRDLADYLAAAGEAAEQSAGT